jgi:hypothetical protein
MQSAQAAMPHTETPGFESAVRFDENRIGAAAVYCSDGRFGEQFDDFLHNGLKLPRYDRLALPGGAACLAGHILASRDEDALLDQLRFLIGAHGLQRMVLIAHHNCAFYTNKLHVPPAQIEIRQREDLHAAAERIHSVARHLAMSAFFARRLPDGKVRFESWSLRNKG